MTGPGPRASVPVLEHVLSDLHEEGEALQVVLSRLTPAQWIRDTPSPGWSVSVQVAHLTWTDQVAAWALRGGQEWDEIASAAKADPSGLFDAGAREGSDLAPVALLERWEASRRTLARDLRSCSSARIRWFGPPMSVVSMATARLMETWAHGVDIRDAVSAPLSPTDRLRHVAHVGVRTRDFSFGVHGLQPPTDPFRVELDSPSGERWSWGPSDARQRVTGSAEGFCLLATRRRHRDDVHVRADGVDADRWLSIAQAYAGPPGPGRRPRSAP